MKIIYNTLVVSAILFAVCFIASASAEIPGRRALRDSVSSTVAQLPYLRSLAEETNHLNLAIVLPLHNPEGLTNLLKNLYDPSAAGFHQWLTPEQFAAQFAPTVDDYQKVVHFAESHGLKVTRTYGNRAIVDVTGPVTNIENAFQTKLRVYQHPTENRTFYAPETEPTVDTNLPVLCVSGLNNYVLPHRIGGAPRIIPFNATNQPVTPYVQTGTAANGCLIGSDFRNALVPGVTNDGAGQYIAVVDVGGPYYPLDIYMYETNAGLSTNIVVTNILLDGSSGIPVGTNTDEGEQVLDIDMAISMAPGAAILNYEGGADDVFNQIAVDDKAKQMTMSYGFGIDSGIIQSFQQFAAQGQSFCQASGDGGADPDGGTGLTGMPYATIVGGIVLSTVSPGGAWESDTTTWEGSGGGISGWGIPDWQIGVATTNNQGSTAYRNYPDVAMPAVNLFTVYKDGNVVGGAAGTSGSSPLWAGFMALVNQQAAAVGNPSAGFINPAIYALGKGDRANYTNCFHDITTGDTTDNDHNHGKYLATPGYDLCTGWGAPTGINTINFLAGIGTNDFVFNTSQGSVTLWPGMTSSNVTIQVSPLNGSLPGSIHLSIAGTLPVGATMALSVSNTTSTSTLFFSTASQVALGTYPLTITATAGGLTHVISFNFIVVPLTPGSTQVALPYNRTGIYTDGKIFNGGLDGSSFAYSANLLGSNLVWNGTPFTLGAANVTNTMSCTGQVVTLPSGNYNNLLLLATAVNGSRSEIFTLTYSDNSTMTYTQKMSDWASASGYPDESVATSMSYRNYGGGVQNDTSVNVYGYSFAVNPPQLVSSSVLASKFVSKPNPNARPPTTVTVKSITFPNDPNVEILGMATAIMPISVPLSAYYNRAGIYTDDILFTTGGIDEDGNAYSANALGEAVLWDGAWFNYGPPNVSNVISAASQKITLPAGQYSSLLILGAAVNGNQPAQSLAVTYTDGSVSNFSQGFSDWVSDEGFGGESNAASFDYRDQSDGTQIHSSTELYGYVFSLNSSKTLQSVTLPDNGNVEILAMSLVPNWSPAFVFNPLVGTNIQAGQTYSATMATDAYDLNGDSLAFAKASGPAWLNVASNGVLSGAPLSADVGTNSFIVNATDPGGLSNQVTLTIMVTPAPPMISTLLFQNGNIVLNWNGGVGPYQVQSATNLLNPVWVNVGGTVSGNSLSITPSNSSMFYRISGQ